MLHESVASHFSPTTGYEPGRRVDDRKPCSANLITNGTVLRSYEV
jgi:hypothetical protein